MIVRKSIDINAPLTAEQLEMLDKAESMPIVYDEDSPELGDEELAEFKSIVDLKQENKKLCDYEDEGDIIPVPTEVDAIVLSNNEFCRRISVDTDKYRQGNMP